MNMVNPVSRAHSRRLIFAALLITALAYMFWTGSRYPSLDEKAMMGGAIQLEDPLGFEAVLPIERGLSVMERIAYSTVNWIDTNKKGMTFGLLFGAAFLTLLGYMRRRNFRLPFSNSLYGMFLGAPLGVCVNCAAPIAKGLYQGGSRAETTLSAMIASPTLNIVVMTMSFSLLPFYIAATKLVLSLLVILVAVPVLCRFIPQEKLLSSVTGTEQAPMAPALEESDDMPVESFPQAVLNFVRDYGRNLWFILRTTLPLMLLAGFLGAVAGTLMPPQGLAIGDFGPLGVGIVAVIGTFMPVPIGFDVVLSGALLNGGASHGYIMALVFTLGSFSIYSFLIVGTSVGWRAAFMLGVIVMVLGFFAGLGAEKYHDFQTRRAIEMLTTEAAAEPLETVVNPLAADTSAAPGQISLERLPYGAASAPRGDTAFTRIEAWQIGIDHPVEFSFADMWPPFWEGRAISSGDIDRDGDVDLVFASTRAGLHVYLNDGSGQFAAMEQDFGAIADMPVFNAVLVDIDDDGWLDLFLATYQQGLYILPNHNGRFDPDSLRPVRNRENAILAMALSFGDVDRDGDLDLALGNWAAGWYRRIPGEESRNRIIFNDDGALSGDSFADLPGIPGETLSILLSDIDHNGTQDLLVGNDFEVPDYFYLGDGAGGFSAITHQDGRIPMTTTTTMSVSARDLTNDGEAEIYLAQIAGRASGISSRLRMQPIEQYCDGILRAADQAVCQQNMDIKAWYRPGNALDPSFADHCAPLAEPYRSECRGMLIKDIAIQNRSPEMCALVPVGQIRARQYCDIHFLPSRAMTAAEQDAAIPQVLARNILLSPLGDGSYAERGRDLGLEVGGWSWDVSIADFDNDGWQDVYIVNGTWVPNEVTPSNIFLRNNGGEGFEEVTEAWGLSDYLITAAATVADLDHDGDLDIVAVPVNGPAVAFVNNARDHHAIDFEFDDRIGNRDGIGARVEIRYGENGEQMQMREVQLGGGYMSFDAPTAHFGLGEATQVTSVSIAWADGGLTRIETPLESGATYRVTRTAQTGTDDPLEGNTP
ncbi:FG-GAP-like repeat-containing protein [Maricaulis sp.]|uniref:FG-GAP-like repeat-containing protein n=1 Tax=Maricaulis sp. TaxID=1486257 RepID=UPI003A932EF0